MWKSSRYAYSNSSAVVNQNVNEKYNILECYDQAKRCFLFPPPRRTLKSASVTERHDRMIARYKRFCYTNKIIC